MKFHRRFPGRLITDADLAALEPRNVYRRQLDRPAAGTPGPSVSNCHVLFRRAFSLGGAEDVCAFIMADGYYKHYVNGRFVALVRQRRFSSISFFQVFPLLATLVRDGEGTLARELLADPDGWRRMILEGATRTFESWGRDTKRNTFLFHLTLACAAAFLCGWDVAAATRYQAPRPGAARGRSRPCPQ